MLQQLTWCRHLSKVNLCNCYKIELDQLLIPIIFTNKCENLILQNVIIDKKWCDSLIHHCDLTNVKYLSLMNVVFGENTMTKLDKKQMIDKLAPKLGNLIKFSIDEPTEDMQSFWKSVLPIIKKNNTLTKLSIDMDLISLFGNRLCEFIKEQQCGVTILSLPVCQITFNFVKNMLAIESVKKNMEKLVIHAADLRGMKLLFKMIDHDDDKKQILNHFKALHVVASYPVSWDDVVNVLSLPSKITHNVCFLVLDNLEIQYRIYDKESDALKENGRFESELKKFLKMIVDMIDKQVPIDVCINFFINFETTNYKLTNQDLILNTFDKFHKLYSPTIGNFLSILTDETTNAMNMSDKYPQCNQYWECLQFPKFEFTICDLINDNPYSSSFFRANARDDIFCIRQKFNVVKLKIQTAQSY